MIISRTPFRVSFFGGGTDFPAWYLKNGGAVLSTAIDKYCYLTCRYLPPFFEHNYRILWSKTERCKNLDEITHPVIPKAVKWMNIDHGLEIHHDGDLPARSGMGSSSSFVVGLLHTFNALNGQMISREKLLEDSLYFEQEILKENVGSQDQTSAVYGGFNVVLLKQNGMICVNPITLPRQKLEEFNEHLMLFFSGISRISSQVTESFTANMKKKESELHQLRGMVDDGVGILNSGTDIKEFGELLHKAWCIKRTLSGKVTNNDCDRIYQTARSAGAVGGKILGAGGGGFILFFVPPSKQDTVRKALDGLVHVPFRINAPGSQIIHYESPNKYHKE